MLYKAGRCSGSFKIAMTIKDLTGARGIGPADKVIRRSTLLKASGLPLPLHSLLPQLFANISSLDLSPRINCGKNHYKYKCRGADCIQPNWDDFICVDRILQIGI